MKIFDAIFNRARQADAEAAAKIDVNDVTKGKFAIEDANREIDRFQGEIKECRANQLSNQKTVGSLNTEIAKYEGLLNGIRAKGNSCKNPDGSVKAGSEAVLEQARKDAADIGKQIDSRTGRRDSLVRDVARDDALYVKLTSQLATAKDTVARAEQNIASLAARQRSAQMRDRFASASSGLEKSKGLAALDTLEKKVEMDESRADAAEEIAAVGSTDTIEERYAAAPGASKHVDF